MLLEETKESISAENPNVRFYAFKQKEKNKTKQNRCPPLTEPCRSHGSPLSLVSPTWTGARWTGSVSRSQEVPG